MTLYKKQTLEDGATVIGDNHGDSSIPEEEFVLKPGQWEEVLALPHDAQRAKVDELVAANGEEWARERGPDSALGREQEAGTPTTDHSSEPDPNR